MKKKKKKELKEQKLMKNSDVPVKLVVKEYKEVMIELDKHKLKLEEELLMNLMMNNVNEMYLKCL